MATTWEMIAVCIQDSVKAEDLARELAFRRELRIDPQKAPLSSRRSASDKPSHATASLSFIHWL